MGRISHKIVLIIAGNASCSGKISSGNVVMGLSITLAVSIVLMLFMSLGYYRKVMAMRQSMTEALPERNNRSKAVNGGTTYRQCMDANGIQEYP